MVMVCSSFGKYLDSVLGVAEALSRADVAIWKFPEIRDPNTVP